MSDVGQAAAELLEQTGRVREALASGDPEALLRALPARDDAFARLVETTKGGVQPEAQAAVTRAVEASEALLEEARRELARAGEALGALGELRRAVEGFQGPAPEARFVSFRA